MKYDSHRGLEDVTNETLLGLLEHCESPIERALAEAIHGLWDYQQHPVKIVGPGAFDPVLRRLPWELMVAPQATVECGDNLYRLDFLFVMGSMPGNRRMLCVECDGHDWHEKTKEQASRDKRRDRQLLMRRIPTVRFTGSEIHRTPNDCADYVEDLVSTYFADVMQQGATRP